MLRRRAAIAAAAAGADCTDKGDKGQEKNWQNVVLTLIATLARVQTVPHERRSTSMALVGGIRPS